MRIDHASVAFRDHHGALANQRQRRLQRNPLVFWSGKPSSMLKRRPYSYCVFGHVGSLLFELKVGCFVITCAVELAC